MRWRPRLFPADMTPRERRVYGGAAAFFTVAFLALVWPIYHLFAGVRPRILGLPLSLAWVILWLALSFLALLGLFLWEGRRERRPGAPRGTRGPPGGRPRRGGGSRSRGPNR